MAVPVGVAGPALDVEHFLADGFDLRQQLAQFLGLSADQLEQKLPQST